MPLSTIFQLYRGKIALKPLIVVVLSELNSTNMDPEPATTGEGIVLPQ
jgi:hypothetical protein